MSEKGTIIGKKFLASISIILEKISKRNNLPLILILGESGTGKGLLAKEIHMRSKHSSEPFLVVNCGTFSESLFESELFGHVKGSYTGAHKNRDGKLLAAGKGTLFLDEVGDLPIGQQVKLLHVLDYGTFYPVGSDEPLKANCKIICATNKNLHSLVSEKKFREDLFWRINVLPVTITPLRDRSDDILELFHYFIKKYKESSSPPLEFSPEAMVLIRGYSWPGNIRELENFAQRICILADEQRAIETEDAKHFLIETLQTSLLQIKLDSKTPFPDDFNKTFAIVLNYILLLFNYNVTRTATALGIGRSRLNYCLKKYNAMHLKGQILDTHESRSIGNSILKEISKGKKFSHVISAAIGKLS